MKLSKIESRNHQAAKDLIARGDLTRAERDFVCESFHEGAEHMNGIAGAFFTPVELAYHVAMEASGRRIIDLCAGSGRLAYAIYHAAPSDAKPELVCVERNPDYAAAGRAILPEAHWIVGDVFSLPDLGQFDTAVSNPPFGVMRPHQGLRARTLEHAVIEIAGRLARHGVFILPAMACPFRVSGQRNHTITNNPGYNAFSKATGITFEPTSTDTAEILKEDGFRNATPAVEIVTVDFTEARAGGLVQSDLLAA